MGYVGRFLLVCICIMSFLLASVNVEADKCDDEIQALENNCSPVLSGNSPSAVCCSLMRSTDMGCVCPKITSQIAALVNVSQAISVIESCGRNVPPHTRCGGIVTP